MKSKIIVTAVMVIVMLLPIIAIAQNLPCRTYGGTMNERAHALVQNFSDGSYVMAGFTTMPLDTNLLIVKIDSSGNPLQAKISYGNKTEIATSMIRTSDDGYAITGWTTTYQTSGQNLKANIFVIKLDNNLNVQWGKVYTTNGDFEERAYSIIETFHTGPGYAVVGWTEYSGYNPSPALFILKLFPDGNVQWVKIYNRRTWTMQGWVNTPTEGYDIVELSYLPNFPNGGFAVTGRGLFYAWDAFMMCVDQVGNVVQQFCKSLMGTNDDEGYSIILDGTDLVIAGWTNSYAPQPPQGPNKANIFVWKTSLINNFDIFGKVYGWADDDEKLMDEQGLIRTIDGNYAVAGWTCSQGPGGGAAPTPNFLIMKVSATNGDVIWSRVHPSIPGANFEEAYPIIQTINSGYAIAGWTNSFGIAQSEDFHFLTLDQNGERPVCVLSLMPDTFWFGTEPDSGVLFTEGFNTTQIPLKDTSVMYTDVCVITQQGDATPTDAVPDTIEVCHSTWFKVTIANVGTGTLAAGWWVHLQIEQEQYFDSLYVSVPIPPQTTYLDSFYVHFNHNCLHRVKIITAYPNDPNNQNDTLNKSVIGRYTDPFEITHLSINPSGPWHVNDYVVFDVKVHNNNKHVSDSMLTTWVYLDIVKPDLSVIRDSQQVVNLAPCDTTTLWFPTQGEFQFDTAGSWYIDAFPAFIPNDSHPDNNYADSTFTVYPELITGDAGIDSIAVPDTVEVCHEVPVTVYVKNYSSTDTLPPGWFVYVEVWQNLQCLDRESVFVEQSILPNSVRSYNFYKHFAEYCWHTISAFTAYPNDTNPNNDLLQKEIVAAVHDPFEITHLSISPSGPWYVNDYVVFDVKVHNNNKHVSDSMLTTWVYLDIVKPDLSVIRDSQQVVNLAPCDTTTLWFPTQGEFQFDTAGSWYIDAFPAFIPGDSHPDNNFADSTITVTIGPVTGPWVQVESMPPLIGVVKWHIKDGGAIVGVPGDKQEISALYAFRGTRTPDFKKYTVGSGWANVETIPFGYKYKPGYPIDSTKFNKKYPGKGAALCYDGYNTIYAVKGNGLWEFWAYDIANDTWVLKPWIPSFKGPKAGSGLAYYDGYVYLLVGSIKLEENYFFRYSVAGDSWEVLPKPTGVTKPWKAGSALAAYNGKIYAMKAGEKPNWFLNFDPSTLEWGTPETLTTFDSVAGGIKKLYVKAGGCMATADDGIYGIKGGGTNTFYKYTTTDGWVQLVSDTIPRLHQKSVPKEGAAMGYVDGKIYLLKGNKTPEFWCYTPYPKENVKPTVAVMNIPSTMAKNLTATYEFSFEVMPNPFKKLTTIHYTVPIADNVSIKLYNVSGRLIKTLVNKHLNAGSYTTTLTNIARGVYFLKYQDNTNTKEVKLIVQ